MGLWLGLALPLISFYPSARDKQGWFSSLFPTSWGRRCHGQPGVGQHPAAASSVMRNATPAISFTPGQHVPVNLW